MVLRGKYPLSPIPTPPNPSKSETSVDNKIEDWLANADIIKAIKADFSGCWGEKRQEHVFIGEKVDQQAVNEVFNRCLLTDEEMRRWERVMSNKKYSSEKVEDKLNGLFEGMLD